MHRSYMFPTVNLQPAGELDASQTPNLLIQALNDSFTGELYLKTQAAEQFDLRFFRGALVRSSGQIGRQAFINALSEQLPAEHISLALAHAREQGIDEFTAVEQLMLLPQHSLDRVLQDCLQRELRRLTQSLGTLYYRFVASASDASNTQAQSVPPGLEPLLLIAETLVESSHLARCREMLLPISRSPLVLQGPMLLPQLDLRGNLRQIVSSLRRQPDSLENLRLRRVAPEPVLIAAIYSLFATRCLTIEDASASTRPTAAPKPIAAPPSGESPRVRAASASGVREIPLSPPAFDSITPPRSGAPARSFTPPGGSVAPPRSFAPPAGSVAPPRSFAPDSGDFTPQPPNSTSMSPSARSVVPPSRPQVQVDEHALEQSALDAWMRAMDNRALAKKALKIAERSAARAPRNPTILYYYGCLLAMNANFIEAEIALKRVLKFEPDHAEAREELEKIERLQKEPTKVSLLGRWVGRKN